MAHGVGIRSVSAEKFQQLLTEHPQQSGSRERWMLVLSSHALTRCGTSDHIHGGFPLQLNLSGKAPHSHRGVSLILNLAVTLNRVCLSLSKDVKCSWVVFQLYKKTQLLLLNR